MGGGAARSRLRARLLRSCGACDATLGQVLRRHKDLRSTFPRRSPPVAFPPTSFKPPEIDDFEAALAETERQLPGITQAVTDREGLHITDTVDFLYLLEGEMELVVGDTVENSERKYLKAGGCVIQNGTHHSWHNRHSELWAKMLVVFVAAQRDP